MPINEKLSQALKGNTNAAKNHAKKGLDVIQNTGKHAGVIAGKAFASTAKSLDKFNDKAIDVRQGLASIGGAAVGASLGAVAGGVMGYKSSEIIAKNFPKSKFGDKTVGVAFGAIGGAFAGAGYGAKLARDTVNSLNEYPEKARQALKNKLNK